MSGFEIQPWAFIPKTNIILENVDGTTTRIDFNNLPDNCLTAYETSEGTIRHFCKSCGATAFAYEKDRPNVVRVSVGLFSAAEGTRAETWLKWRAQRIGFEEQAKVDRSAEDKHEANDVVGCYARDLVAWVVVRTAASGYRNRRFSRQAFAQGTCIQEVGNTKYSKMLDLSETGNKSCKLPSLGKHIQDIGRAATSKGLFTRKPNSCSHLEGGYTSF